MCGTLKMLLLFIILLQAPPMLNRPPIQAAAKPILYVLSLQWGISFCRDPSVVLCKQPVAQNFTIHGLWLYNEYEAIAPASTAGRDLFRSDVNGNWELKESCPSHLAVGTNFQLWRGQWLKHGRYLGLQPGQYFQKAVELKKQIDDKLGGSLAQFFIGKGLRPSETTLYDACRFLNQIKISTSFITQMQCNINKEVVVQLYEIRFCFNDRWEWVNCPGYNQPSYPRNKQGANSYPKRGPNSQRKSPPPPPPPPPSFRIGLCYASGWILFPALIPAPPPPPPPRTPAPAPPLPLPPPPPSKSPQLRRKQWPPPPPSAQTPLKAPLPSSPSLPSYTAVTFARILLKGLQQSPPAPSASPPPNAKRGRRWRLLWKPILTLNNVLIQFGVLGALRKLRRRSTKSSRNKNARWLTFIYFFHCFGHHFR